MLMTNREYHDPSSKTWSFSTNGEPCESSERRRHHVNQLYEKNDLRHTTMLVKLYQKARNITVGAGTEKDQAF